MLKRILLGLASTLLVIWVLYVIMANKDRHIALPPTDTQFRAYNEVSRDSGRGNLIGIQPYMLSVDYSSEEAFFQKMNGYFAEARKKGWFNAKTIVVLPENLGTWLVAMDEKRSVYTTRSISEAMQILVYSNVFAFASARIQAPREIEDKAGYSIFAMKAPDMANTYQSVFSQLAQTYDVTIVAGSILLPSPAIVENKLVVGGGPLYSVCGIFKPDGSLSDLIQKAYPTESEKPLVAPGNLHNNPLIRTPAGNLAVIIGNDSWASVAYADIHKKGANLVVVPAYEKLANSWLIPWHGYDGFPTPQDGRSSIDSLRVGQAWVKYTMPTRAPKEAAIQRGMTVFLKGELWNLSSDGLTLMLRDQPIEGTRIQAATLSCLWL
ncbi:MAG: hypothetical protein QM669_08955 [Siphonobacter sp.]